MRAAFFRDRGKPLVIKEIEQPVPAKDQVIVQLKNAALTHRDLWIHKEQSNVFSLEEVNEAMHRMESGAHFGQIVLQIES